MADDVFETALEESLEIVSIYELDSTVVSNRVVRIHLLESR